MACVGCFRDEEERKENNRQDESKRAMQEKKDMCGSKERMSCCEAK